MVVSCVAPLLLVIRSKFVDQIRWLKLSGPDVFVPSCSQPAVECNFGEVVIGVEATLISNLLALPADVCNGYIVVPGNLSKPCILACSMKQLLHVAADACN